MSTNPSRGLLTAGGVGGWLNAGAMAICLIALFMMMGRMGDLDDGFFLGLRLIIGFLVLAGLVWLAGLVCITIGWFALSRVEGRIHHTVGILNVIFGGLIIVAMPIGMVAGESQGVALVYNWIIQGFFLLLMVTSAVAMLKIRHARGVARAAAVGYALAVISHVTLNILGFTGGGFGTPEIALWAGITLCTGLALGYLGTGLAMLKSRDVEDPAEAF